MSDAHADLRANEWLLAHGHNNGGCCEKCWRQAGWLWGTEYETKTDAYHAVMERAQNEALAATSATAEATP
jgi:hypothetical protein